MTESRGRYWAWALIGMGVLLRVARWAGDRSFWLDEILLVRNLMERSVGGLLGRLDYGQGAPPLFLLMEKGTGAATGYSEMGLRVVPLVAGCVALWLMWEVGRRLLDERAAVVAVGILALLEPAIYYSSEAKQYSTDLLVTLGVMWGFLRWREGSGFRVQGSGKGIGAWGALAVIGVVGMFLAHPAVFVLVGCGVGMMVWERARWREVAGLLGVWGVVFVGNYFLFLRGLGDEAIRRYWAEGFMPWSWTAGPWVANALLGVFGDYATMWLRWPVVGLGVAGVGVARVFVASPGRGLFLVGPVVVAMGAAGVHGYPFLGRLILFLVPVAVLAMAGVVYCGLRSAECGLKKGGVWARAGGVGAWAVVGVLLVDLAWGAGRRLVRPPGREEVEVVLAEMGKRVGEGDVVYVYFGARAGWEFYGGRYGIKAREVILGRNRDEEVGAFEEDVKRLAGKGRVWLLFAHTPTGDGGDARLVELLPGGARRREAIEAKGAAGYLYEF